MYFEFWDQLDIKHMINIMRGKGINLRNKNFTKTGVKKLDQKTRSEKN